MKKFPLLFALILLAGCGPSAEEIREKIAVDPGHFSGYWYQGKAELTRYRLEQARYGEIREGDAVLIYVTEDFLEELQVKRDYGNEKADPVLKLNFTKNFETGIYPYSLMTSIFSVVSHNQPVTPKVSFSGQEWCGHVYTQLNRRKNGYEGTIHSYFQNEADKVVEVGDVVLEDSIWTTIRLAPNTLPLGKVEMLPSLEHSRLRHHELEPVKVEANIAVDTNTKFHEDPVYVYSLEYASGRKLVIYFEKNAPHKIRGWEETTQSGDEKMTTTAVMTHSMFEPYWQMNRNSDAGARERLGLE